MDLASFPVEAKLAALRAMKMVAASHGDVTAEERSALEAAAGALDVPCDVVALEPITPEGVAAAVPDPVWRRRLVQALIVVAAMDTEVTADEATVVDRFAKGLGVDDPYVSGLHRIVNGQMARLRIDFLRRASIPRQVLGDAWKEEGLAGVWKFVQAARGKSNEPEIAWKYKKLGLLPEGTLGRAFWAHMTRNGFGFPGEPGGIPEGACHHDVTHVLTGYDTDPEGETQIGAFYAGFLKEDPFALVFGTMLMFHLGIKLAPIATPAKGKLDPHKILRAMERGSRINRDLTDHWDFWPDMELSLEEVRRKYNISEA